MIEEIWKPVVGYDGYEVSDLGRVRSYRLVGRPGVRAENPHTLIPSATGGGNMKYQHVSLGKGKVKTVHVVVATAFHGPCPKGLECRHKDGDHYNNRASNLEWGTRRQNLDDRAKHGRMVVGEQVITAKLTAEQVLEIRAIKGSSHETIASAYGVVRQTVSRVMRGESWKHLIPA